MDLVSLASIKHSGAYYGPGDVVTDVSQEDAEMLVSGGYARYADDSEAIEESNDQEPANVIDLIVKLYPELDPDSDFTANDVPKVDVLSEKLGFDVTAQQRDEAMSVIEASNDDV